MSRAKRASLCAGSNGPALNEIISRAVTHVENQHYRQRNVPERYGVL
jgi:hypothetical protein